MDLERFNDLPDEARVWIYPFDPPLDREGKETVARILDRFLPTWRSHGQLVKGAFEIAHDRFLILAGYCPEGISGCSIDSSVRPLKELRERFGIDGLQFGRIYFRDHAGEIQAVEHLEFHRMAASGKIRPDTPVFDTLIQSLGALRAGKLESTFQHCWHARTFALPA